jgi:hypothetical protein
MPPPVGTIGKGASQGELGPGIIRLVPEGSFKGFLGFRKFFQPGIGFPQHLPVRVIGCLGQIDKSGRRFPEKFFNFLGLKADELK